MVIILIRRFVRPDREEEFLAAYRDQAPNANPAFRGETLTRVNDSSVIPADLKTLSLKASDGITYLNIAKWDTWKAFEKHFANAGIGFDPRIEIAAAQQLVLDVIYDSAELDNVS